MASFLLMLKVNGSNASRDASFVHSELVHILICKAFLKKNDFLFRLILVCVFK